MTTKNSLPLLQKYGGLLSLAMVGLMFCVYAITNKVMVAISGGLVLSLMGWGIYETYRSKNVDSNSKRVVWLALLVAASIIVAIIAKLFGPKK